MPGKVEIPGPGVFHTAEIAPMKLWRLPRSTRVIVALLAACLLFAMGGSVARAGKHPEPSLYPLPNAWYLSFKYGTPKRIVVDAPGLNVPTAFWYLTYTVTNNTGHEIDFLPVFEMLNEDGKVRRSDDNIPIGVFNAIKKTEGDDLLVRAAQIAGPLHQGEDQAKDGVAIWEEPTPRMGHFTIFVGGLSDEFVLATDNDGKPINGADGKQIVLRKTLQLDYVIYGDEVKPELDEVHFLGEKWIMR